MIGEFGEQRPRCGFCGSRGDVLAGKEAIGWRRVRTEGYG
jgi:hypothetical protein